MSTKHLIHALGSIPMIVLLIKIFRAISRFIARSNTGSSLDLGAGFAGLFAVCFLLLISILFLLLLLSRLVFALIYWPVSLLLFALALHSFFWDLPYSLARVKSKL